MVGDWLSLALAITTREVHKLCRHQDHLELLLKHRFLEFWPRRSCIENEIFTFLASAQMMLTLLFETRNREELFGQDQLV